ncbi:MAG: ATP-binding protein, partial [Gaiellaceae bacterium]
LELCAGALPGAIAIDDATRAAARGREFRLDRPLVGRDGERQQLRAAFARAVGGQSGVGITLIGPAGIGKSRLATDLLGSLGGDTRVAIARCLSYGDGIALWPAVELVRVAAGLSPGVSESAARARLGSLVGTGDRSAGAVDQLLALLGLSDDAVPDDELPWAVRRLFEGLATRQPVVVYVDDLHWAAPPVVDMLVQLAHADGRVFVLATARTPAAAAIGETIELGPLDPAACGEVVAGLLGAERVEDVVLAPLVQASDGNPFFLEELVRDLRATGRLHEEDDGWALEGGAQRSGGVSPPRSIQMLLADRLAQLPAAERDVLMCASVMGRSFARVALVQLLEADPAESLEALVAAQLLQPTTAEDVDFEFRHLLIRDASYAML